MLAIFSQTPRYLFVAVTFDVSLATFSQSTGKNTLSTILDYLLRTAWWVSTRTCTFLSNSAVYETFLLCTLSLLGYWICKYIAADYQAFLDLGPGGTSSNPWGYWHVKYLSLFRINVHQPPPIPNSLAPAEGLLRSLPPRTSPRPKVFGIAPQRQRPRAARSTYQALLSHQSELAVRFPSKLYADSSFLEGRIEALKVRPGARSISPTASLFGNEICHPHPVDGSMHIVLHPADIKIVLENGWGERHPIARGDWWWKFYFKTLKGWFVRPAEGSWWRPPVPEEMIILYAPMGAGLSLDKKEMDVVKRIMAAGVWWMAGFDPDNMERERT